MVERKSTAQETAFATQQQIDSTAKIPLVEEQLNIGKRIVETGKVKIRKRIDTKRELLDVPEIHENVKVERIAVNRLVEAAPPPIRYEGNTMIISILREEVVVTKRLVLVEELHVNKEQIEVHNPTEIDLLAENIEIERTK